MMLRMLGAASSACLLGNQDGQARLPSVDLLSQLRSQVESKGRINVGLASWGLFIPQSCLVTSFPFPFSLSVITFRSSEKQCPQ